MSEDRLIDTAVTGLSGGAGFAGVLFTMRWLLNWLAGRMDKKQAQLDLQDAKLDAEWREIRAELKGDNAILREENAALGARIAKVEGQGHALRLSFQLVSSQLRALDPVNPALAQAEQLLEAAFPLDPEIPPAMGKALGAID